MNSKKIRLALAGNPNSGKTTLFNDLTGANQVVGNWPGVTVEQKLGSYRKNHNIQIVDLPGIYSLSPYTAEEIVTRDYLVREKPEVIIDIVDASNIERNLYLTTQLLELGLPVVIALNMMDVVNARGDIIDVESLQRQLGCQVVEISALQETNLEGLIAASIKAAEENITPKAIEFPGRIEHALRELSELISSEREGGVEDRLHRYTALKLLEGDSMIINDLVLGENQSKAEAIIGQLEKELDDDRESIVISARYDYVTELTAMIRRRAEGKESFSAKVDKFVTSKVLGLPIFALVMAVVYGVSVSTVGQWATDFTNDVFVEEWIKTPAADFLESAGASEALVGLVCDGIIGGVGAILGFMPQMVVLFLFLAILEDCGYMARIAFLLDLLFRRFGMSGKSFIPMLVGTGCGVPGIMAARTIENPRDRRLTIMSVTFMPCGAKLPLIAMITGALFDNNGWIAFSAYALGIVSVIVTGITLKQFTAFAGAPTPFVIELPDYHFPSWKNVRQSILLKLESYARKVVTIYIFVSTLVWFMASFGFGAEGFGMIESLEDSLCRDVGALFAWIFTPCGFDSWQAVVATLLGLAAKEEIVGVLGVLSSIGDGEKALEMVEAGENLGNLVTIFGGSKLAGYSFMAFNLLCAPCFAAMATIVAELDSKWEAAFAIGYECIFAYVVSLIIYQLGSWYLGGPFTLWTGTAAALLLVMTGLLIRGIRRA